MPQLPLIDADVFYQPLDAAQAALVADLPPGRSAERAIRLHWSRPDVAPFLPNATAGNADTVEAFVNDGRWLVQCPDCNGAQIAARDDKRFFCADCLNVAVDGKWRKVAWPAQQAALEAEIVKRPALHTRSWRPGETLADVRAHNAAHGID